MTEDQSSPAPPQPSAQAPPSNGLAIAALVCGLLSLPLAILFLPVGLLLAVAAVGFGIVALRRVQQGTGAGQGMAIAGLATGALGLLLSIVVIVFLVRILSEVDLDAPPEEIEQQLEEELEEMEEEAEAGS